MKKQQRKETKNKSLFQVQKNLEKITSYGKNNQINKGVNQQKINKKQEDQNESNLKYIDSFKKIINLRQKNIRKSIQNDNLQNSLGRMKKPKNNPQYPNIAETIRDSSPHLFPIIKNTKLNFHEAKLSKNILYNTLLPNKVRSSSVQYQKDQLNNQIISHSTILSHENVSKYLLTHRVNKFDSSLPINPKISSQKQIKINKSINNINNLINLNQGSKKGFLQNIVNRYFPKQNQNNQILNNKQQQKLSIRKQIKRKQFFSKQKNQNQNYHLSPRRNQINQGKKQVFQIKQEEQLVFKNPQSKNMSLNQNQMNKVNNQNQSKSQNQINPLSKSIIMSNSYMLQKIDQDQQKQQQINLQYNNDFNMYSKSLSSSIFLTNSSQKINNISNNNDCLKNCQNLIKRTKIFQNHSFLIYKYQYISGQKFSTNSSDIKKFIRNYEYRKYFLNQPALQLKKRQLKAKQILEKYNDKSLIPVWNQDQFQKNCLKLNLNLISPPSSFKDQIPMTLSKLLYKLIPIKQTQQKRSYLIKLNNDQRSFINQKKLLQDHHKGLIFLIYQIASQLKKVQNQVINNKICLNNILLLDQNKYGINQWSYGYFRNQYDIQNKVFQKRLQPIFKNQFDQWFSIPQYMAPEILQNLIYIKDKQIKYLTKISGKKIQKKIVTQNDLFKYGNVSDVWSLGLMILQIITLIPISIQEKTIIQNRNNPKFIPRKGFLHVEKRNLSKLLTYQSYLKDNLKKIIKSQSYPFQIQEWLQLLISSMLELEPENRINLEEIIEKLTQIKQKYWGN